MRAALTRRPARSAAVALAAFAAIALFALPHAGSAGATARVLAGAQVPWTLALLGLAAAGPVLHSGLLRAGQATVGAHYGRWEAIRLAAAIHAANLAIRIAGVAGLGVLLADERAGAVGRVPRSVAYVLGREVQRIATAGLVLTALVLRGLDGHLSTVVAAGAALFFVFRVAHPILLWLAATHPHSLPRWGRLERLRALAPPFAAALRQAAGHPGGLIRIAAWAIALDTLSIGWLWVALHAVGAHTSVDVTVEAYGVVALLGTINFLPAGLGAVDAGLVATLHHSGVTLAAAVAGILLFRVAELWVPLAAGVRPALVAARRRVRCDKPPDGGGAMRHAVPRAVIRATARWARPIRRAPEIGPPWPHRASSS